MRERPDGRDHPPKGRADRAVRELGADAAFTVGASLPGHVDAVVDSVGAATFQHSLEALRPGGRLVVVGAVGGSTANLDLTDVFRRSITIFGSAMGNQAELERLASFCVENDIRPLVQSSWPISRAVEAFESFGASHRFGKVVLDFSRAE